WMYSMTMTTSAAPPHPPPFSSTTSRPYVQWLCHELRSGKQSVKHAHVVASFASDAIHARASAARSSRVNPMEKPTFTPVTSWITPGRGAIPSHESIASVLFTDRLHCACTARVSVVRSLRLLGLKFASIDDASRKHERKT